MKFSRRLANLAKTVIRKSVAAALLPAGKVNRDRLYFELAQDMVPIKEHRVGGRTLRFVCPSYDSLYRFEQFFVKEPETPLTIYPSSIVCWTEVAKSFLDPP